LLSLVLRLGWVLLADPEPKLKGGDGPFYLHLGEQIKDGRGLRYGEPVAVVGPVYPAYLAGLQLLLGQGRVVSGARVGQAIIGVWMVALMFELGRRWRGRRVGLLAAGLAAVDFRFVVEGGSISTESLLTALMVCSLWLYLLSLERDRTYLWVLTGVIIGVTALTRGVVQFLPLVLLVHLGAQRTGRRLWRAWGLLISGFMLVVSPWMIRNWMLFGSPNISHGGAAHFWMGARGDGRSLRKSEMLTEIDALRIGGGGADRYSYFSDALGIIASDPLRFVQLRARRIAEAYLQPYGTVTLGVVLGNESIKLMLSRGSGYSMADVAALPAFWPKLWMYMLHFGSILMAIYYVLVRWQAWREWIIFAIPVLYFSVVYALLTVIPRYLFPIMPLYILLAAGALVDFGLIAAKRLRIRMARCLAGAAMTPEGRRA
jgi:4-amino-4-deoxy-L-arabinose transferase-like glycosyltransferase